MLSGLREGQELQINDLQMKTMERLIAHCADGTDFAKQVIIWMLRHTHRLSDEVALHIPESIPEGVEVADAMHAMDSCGGKSHAHLLFPLMGSHMMFIHHCGYCLDPLPGEFADKGYTLWLSRDWYNHSVPQLKLDMKAIMAIDVEAIRKG
jgi:hypothetical protein